MNSAETENSKLFHQPVLGARTDLNHVPLASPRTYYRSKKVTVTTGINPLVAAAASLLTAAADLRALPSIPNAYELYQELVHEIKAFETQSQSQSYRSEIILVARYILCTTLDEVILNTPWGKQSDWYQYKLLTTFHGEDWGGERFFLILERLSADIALHIDILELIYLCLNLGYTGKYQILENSHAELENVTDTLYQSIRWQRGEIKKDLLLQEQALPTVREKTPLIPLWLFLVCIFMILLSVYIIFNFMLGSNSNTLYQQLNNFLQTYG